MPFRFCNFWRALIAHHFAAFYFFIYIFFWNANEETKVLFKSFEPLRPGTLHNTATPPESTGPPLFHFPLKATVFCERQQGSQWEMFTLWELGCDFLYLCLWYFASAPLHIQTWNQTWRESNLDLIFPLQVASVLLSKVCGCVGEPTPHFVL